MIKEPKPFIFPKYKTMKQFKPFDKVLAKVYNTWEARFFDRIDKMGRYQLTSGAVVGEKDILPFEGNEHLLGTNKEPEEEITLKEGERIVCSDTINRLLDGCGIIETLSKVCDSVIDDSEGCPWKYCIPYSQFKEKNTEHDILCVKNGKLIKYESVL